MNNNAAVERARNKNLAKDAYGSYKNSKFANQTFRPDQVGNPLFNVHPKSAKVGKDFVDAGFGKNGVFNVSTMAKGAQRVNNFNSDIWNVPMLAITNGRK